MLQTYGLGVEQGRGGNELCVGFGDDLVFGPVIALSLPGSAVASLAALPPLDLPLAETLLARARPDRFSRFWPGLRGGRSRSSSSNSRNSPRTARKSGN